MALAASNHQVKELRRLLGRRSSRLVAGHFVIEGPVLIEEAIAAGVELDTVYVDERWAADTGWQLAGTDGPRVEAVTAGVLASLLSTTSPQPLCATAPLLDAELDAVVARCVTTARPLLVLAEVTDPGNVGTILRAGEASGCAGAVLTAGSADLFNPKTVRASAGSVFRLPVALGGALDAVIATTCTHAMVSWAAVARDGVPHLAADLSGAVAIVVGNEAHGLSPDEISLCDRSVSVTMEGPSESLNVAMAATVLAFEAARQRLVSGATGLVGHNGGHARD